MTTLLKARPGEVPTPEERFYAPRGAADRLMGCRAEEVLLSGPAGTGKSRACLEKLHLAAEKYAGMRGIILRKTRESLTEAALVTFEEKVVPPGHPILSGTQRRMRQAYHYPNGSELVIGGLDKASKIMSTEYDMAYVQEAIELEENDWESLTTRLRNGVMPYQQLIADTNPDTPTHWLIKRCESARTLLLDSRHEDNPTVTPEYLAKLDALTGPRLLRLRHGRWVAAEGVVYDGWDRAVHLIDRFPIPKEWPRHLAVDFGFTNPFTAQWWAEDPDGRLYLYREIYMSHRLVEDHAAEIRELSKGEPVPVQVVCDHDAEGQGTLAKHLGWRMVNARKAVQDGIQAVAARLRKADDGRPRLFILRDAVVERDPLMEEAKRPTCTAEEFDGYIWDLSNNRKRGEEPVKKDDHGMDCLRYAVMGLNRNWKPWAI